MSQMKLGAIINTSSGGCDSESELEMVDILKVAGVTNCKKLCVLAQRGVRIGLD